jgi:plasmid stabilization system protein ParE
MKARFHPAAEQELAAAVALGEARGFGLGLELLAEAKRVADLLCDTPRIGAPLGAAHRRFPLRRFPLALIYRVDGDVLYIVGVAHRRQRPGYWQGRV